MEEEQQKLQTSKTDEQLPEEMNDLETLSDAVGRGERIKVLYEYLMKECNVDYNNTLREVMEAIKSGMTKYYDALEKLSGTVGKRGIKLTKKR